MEDNNTNSNRNSDNTDNDNESAGSDCEKTNNGLSKNSKSKPVIEGPDRQTAIRQQYSQCTSLSLSLKLRQQALSDEIMAGMAHSGKISSNNNQDNKPSNNNNDESDSSECDEGGNSYRCSKNSRYPSKSLIDLPQSILSYVTTFMFYCDFDTFVKSNKEILTACIPTWQRPKNKNDNNRAVSVYNGGRNENERGFNSQFTRSMAHIQLIGLIIELERLHSDNENRHNNHNHYNKGSYCKKSICKTSNIGRTIEIEFDTLYDDLKFVIPKIIRQFENDPKLTIVTMRLNGLNDHLGNINHSKCGCILEFIDLILYVISKRQINSYNDCIRQILHKLGMKNDYSLSLLTIIERYGEVELSEITLEKASGIVTIEDIAGIFGLI